MRATIIGLMGIVFAMAGGALLNSGGKKAAAADSFPVVIQVDAAQTKGPLKPIWRFFGADEPNYAYMADAPHWSEIVADKPNEPTTRIINSTPAQSGQAIEARL